MHEERLEVRVGKGYETAAKESSTFFFFLFPPQREGSPDNGKVACQQKSFYVPNKGVFFGKYPVESLPINTQARFAGLFWHRSFLTATSS